VATKSCISGRDTALTVGEAHFSECPSDLSFHARTG
jgi:hypothetical protein